MLVVMPKFSFSIGTTYIAIVIAADVTARIAGATAILCMDRSAFIFEYKTAEEGFFPIC